MKNEEHIAALKKQGLLIDDEKLLNEFLQHVGMYRMEEYFHRHRQRESGDFFTGTTFQRVVDVYIFDRRLRGLLLDAIDRIEVALRANICCVLENNYGDTPWEKEIFRSENFWEPFWENSKDSWSKNKRWKEFYQKNTSPHPPIDVLVHVCSFGEISMLFRELKSSIKKEIVSHIGGIPIDKFENWMNGIRYLRNKAAHHERVWNETLTLKLIPPKNLHCSFEKQDSVGAYIKIIYTLLQIVAPGSSWMNRLKNLTEEYRIPLSKMDLEDFFL